MAFPSAMAHSRRPRPFNAQENIDLSSFMLTAMPSCNDARSCIAVEEGALAFRAPLSRRQAGDCRVILVDVFSLKGAAGYTRDPDGQILLESQSIGKRTQKWRLEEAVSLIRDGIHPHRWIALELDQQAWDLFWSGGGLLRCRKLLKRCKIAQHYWPMAFSSRHSLLRFVVMYELRHANRHPPVPPPQTSDKRYVGMRYHSPLIAISLVAWAVAMSLNPVEVFKTLQHRASRINPLTPFTTLQLPKTSNSTVMP